ncbi:MAG: NAD(P)/FAD-dependent oxidoreductase [Chloroflexi bacterium]|nr:NAD(P)/FAD-dependent oxidoreductase [Chloroflexota bacterium]
MRLAIVGNGVAGVTTARYVAERDPEAQITIYSRESYPYYPRPRLIDFIEGEVSLEAMPQYDAGWYSDRHIETRLSSEVVALDPADHTLTLASGEKVGYDVLVLATGASSFIPPIPGAAKAGVGALRTLDDAVQLCHAAEACREVVILGGGLLGLDSAVSLTHYDVQITVIEALPRLLPRQLDREGAALLQSMLEARGLTIVTGAQCAQVLGSDRVEGVLLADGSEIDACLLLISAGVRPNIALAQGAGLACNRGILVDARMMTSVPGIYAVGDCAEYDGHVWGIIPAALAQARVAGAQITGGTDVLYTDIVPSTTLKVSGVDLTSLGEVNPEGAGFTEYRYLDAARGIYKKAVLREGHLTGAILLGDRRDLQAVHRLVAQGTDVTEIAEMMLTPEFDLPAWVRSQA